MTLTELTEQWKKSKIAFVKPSTLAAYLLLIKTHILPHLGDRDILTLKNCDLQNLAIDIMNKGLAIRSAKDVLIVVKMILVFGAENELMSPIVCNVRYPSKNIECKQALVVYSTSEQKAIIDYATNNPSPQNLAILLVLCTGMRIGEICGLTWQNIDIDNKVITINSTMQRIYLPDESGKWSTIVINGSPKTRESNRTIPIPMPLLPLLRSYKKTVRDCYYVSSCSKLPIEPRTLRNYYGKFIKDDVGLDRCLKFHGLRHTFATKMVESGADLKTISSILGHSNVSITMNLYVHPTDANKAASVNKAMKNLFK